MSSIEMTPWIETHFRENNQLTQPQPQLSLEAQKAQFFAAVVFGWLKIYKTPLAAKLLADSMGLSGGKNQFICRDETIYTEQVDFPGLNLKVTFSNADINDDDGDDGDDHIFKKGSGDPLLIIDLNTGNPWNPEDNEFIFGEVTGYTHDEYVVEWHHLMFESMGNLAWAQDLMYTDCDYEDPRNSSDGDREITYEMCKLPCKLNGEECYLQFIVENNEGYSAPNEEYLSEFTMDEDAGIRLFTKSGEEILIPVCSFFYFDQYKGLIKNPY